MALTNAAASSKSKWTYTSNVTRLCCW